MNNSMVVKAEQYLYADTNARLELIKHYNEYCLPYVKANRKYSMGLNDNWCAMFTTVIANKCGISSNVFPYEVSVGEQVKWAKENYMFTTDLKVVEAGDLIIYDWDSNGVYDHVGIVKKVDSKHITVIEGNKNNTVDYRQVNIGSKSVVGFIKTTYKTEPETKISQQEKEQFRIADLVRRTVRGDFGNGLERARRLGGDYAEVQNRINRMF